MKTTLLFLLMAFATSLNAQIVNISDQNFKYALLHHTFFGGAVIDTNGDGEIQVSEAQAVTVLSVGDPWVSFHIQDLTGIQAFVNITALNVWNNSLTYMDLSQNTALEILYCTDNQISTLNLSQNTALKELYCDNNPLTFININQNLALEIIKCENTSLTTLDISKNSSLKYFYGSNNLISSINIGQNTSLVSLWLNNNQLSTLDLRQCTSLATIECDNNQLTYLNVRNGNNANITSFSSINNPNLTCIFVDNATYSQTNNYWHKDTASIYVETQAECDAVVGVEDFFLEQIKIYPNPVENFINIELFRYNPHKLKIRDLSGKILLDTQLKTLNSKLNISHLQNGIYFLSIQNNNNQSFIRKIIKL